MSDIKDALKKTLIQMTIIIAGIFVSKLLLDVVYSYLDHRITQEVTEVDYKHRLECSNFYSKTQMYCSANLPYERKNEIDSLAKEESRITEADYKLTTTYNHHSITDYGDAKFIDSIKCIRHREMVNLVKVYDTQDSLKIVKDNIAKYKIKLKEIELDRLNEKVCPN